MHLQRAKYSGKLEKAGSGRKPKPYEACRVGGCSRDAVRRASGLCEMHFYRLRRNGTTEKAPLVPRAKRGNGYVWLNSKAHPLAGKSGLYEHRAVVYDANGGECPACVWCGCVLTWPRAVVDHLNERKDDNTPGNLVVSCSPCNRARGAIKPFLAGLTEEGLRLFIRCAREYRGALQGLEAERLAPTGVGGSKSSA